MPAHSKQTNRLTGKRVLLSANVGPMPKPRELVEIAVNYLQTHCDTGFHGAPLRALTHFSSCVRVFIVKKWTVGQDFPCWRVRSGKFPPLRLPRTNPRCSRSCLIIFGNDVHGAICQLLRLPWTETRAALGGLLCQFFPAPSSVGGDKYMEHLLLNGGKEVPRAMQRMGEWWKEKTHYCLPAEALQ